MNIIGPQTYLAGLIGVLIIFSILIARQLLRVRRDEMNLIELEKGGASNSKEASELYELASVQLRKRLYPQATSTLKKALKAMNDEPDEATALIENALGFALAAQDEFKSAVTHYRKALQAKADYPVAINNLAFAQQRLNQNDEAKKLYIQVLSMDPKNKTAIKQLKSLNTTQTKQSPKPIEDRGF